MYIRNYKKISDDPQNFSTSEKTCFVRQSKFGFEKLMQFILSFGSNSLGHEIGEFFEYSDSFPTTSAFVQQCKKLSYEAFKYLFHEFIRQINNL